jgi:DNA-binding transcriptional regulator YiaG
MNNNDNKQIQALAQIILSKAGFKLGDDALAKYLGVSDGTLAEWLSGKTVPPAEAILKAVHLLDPRTP